MKGAPSTCSVCGSRIHPAAFGKGGALALLRRAYCPRCVDRAASSDPALPKVKPRGDRAARRLR